MVAILYNIRSLHNVGSIFRTADGAGVEKLYLVGFTPTPLNEFNQPRPQLTKVSLGAQKTVAWEYVRQIGPLLKKLRSEGCKIIGVERSPWAIPYNRLKIKNKKSKIAVIVGHEVRGLPKRILEACDTIIEIPMRGQKESLNVSVAFGIVAYELIQQWL